MDPKRLMTIRNTAKLYPSFTERQLRWMIERSDVIGFEKCAIRIGRRILINLDQFEKFLDNRTLDKVEKKKPPVGTDGLSVEEKRAIHAQARADAQLL